MPKGFFDEVTEAPRVALPLVARCGACGLFKGCRSPKMEVSGKGLREVLIVGEFPGRSEDEEGYHFCGETGGLLERSLHEIGVRMRRDCWLTNAAICRPSTELDPKVIDHCRPNLIRTIEELKPKAIILLGGHAVKSLIGYRWRYNCGDVFRWIGWRIPDQKYNCWICPNLHPVEVLKEKKNQVVALVFKRFLEQAFAKKNRPWVEIPDYPSQCRVELDSDRAARVVRSITANSESVAFDYETTMLKPDAERARIVSCSVSNGDTTIAYPWHGDAINATGELLRSDVGKIASNLKFEERWTRKAFGKGVKNWRADTMLDAHILDNRGGTDGEQGEHKRDGITSIKFQAYVLLGQSPWDDQVKDFLTSDGSNKENRIREVDLPTLLKYNAMDSLMEYLVHRKQKKEIERG
jgi:uracil-DNA glycosylase family 4